MVDQPRSAPVVRRHGAIAAVETGDTVVTLEAYPTLTRRGSRRMFASLEQRLVSGMLIDQAARAGLGDVLIAARLESGRVVREIRLPLGGDDEPHAGVREPRRPYPEGGVAEARAPRPGA